jgi:indole-3-glycerol phosphate synthase
MSVLDEILAWKRDEVARARAERSLGHVVAECRTLPPARDMERALRPSGTARVRLVAEVKKASPSRGVLSEALDPARQARAYQDAGAAAVSVLTDARYFGGSLDDLLAVRATVEVPVLRKEFVVDEYQLWESRAAGADAVLLIVAGLPAAMLRDLYQAAQGVGVAPLVEAHTERELERALGLGAALVGVNNRDLHTLDTDLAVSLRLIPLIPPGPVAVSESGISSREDVERVVTAGAHAVLVGEALVRADDVAGAVRELSLAEAPMGGGRGRA